MARMYGESRQAFAARQLGEALHAPKEIIVCCPKCDGTGLLIAKQTACRVPICPNCGGTGSVVSRS